MNRFYGFDSFERLPEDWIPEYEEGTFARTGLPEVSDNAKLVVRWFDNSIRKFIKREDVNCKKIDFIHLDCDLYTCIKTFLNILESLLKRYDDCI